MTSRTRRGGRSLLAVATSGMLAAGALLMAPAVASAAEEPLESGDLSWGIRESWRGYVGVGSVQAGPGSPGKVLGENGASASEQGIGLWEATGGSLDLDSGTGELDFGGTVLLLGHPGTWYPYEYPAGSGEKWGMWQRWSNPSVTFASPTEAVLSMEVTSFSAAPSFPTLEPVVVEVAELKFEADDLEDGEATSSSAVLTEVGAQTIWNSYGSYQAGAKLDPVSINFTLEKPVEAVPTTTTVTASNTSPSQGEEVTLFADVNPAAEGTVQFSLDGAKLGAPVAVTTENPRAVFSTNALGLGEHALTAQFTPNNPESFTASTSQALAIKVGFGATATTTTVEVSPKAPVVVGSPVTLKAVVTEENPAGAPTGSVQFFQTPSGGTAQPIGTPVALNAEGVAETTTSSLGAGGHTFSAAFTSDNGFDSSEAVVAANYGVVDVSQPELCSVEGGAVLSGVSAAWDWSAYSNEPNHVPGGSGFAWQKFASGNIEVEVGDSAETFVLSDGIATVTEDCTRVAFTGTMRVEAYQGFFPTHGQWVELVNPELVVNSDGTGAWTAEVRSGERELNEDSGERIAVVTIEDASGVDFSKDLVDAEVSFAFEDTTASGTWSAGRTGAWSNAFVLKVPTSIRSFYYLSGAGGDAKKSASPLSMDWEFSSTPVAAVDGKVEGAEVEQGKTAALTAEGFLPGETVEVELTGVGSLGEGTADQAGKFALNWTVPKDLKVGDHQVVFTSANPSRVAAASFEVVEASVIDDGETPQSGDNGDEETPQSGENSGSGSNGNGSENGSEGSGKKPASGQQLPKTGAEGLLVGGLAAALTLLSGAGLVAFSRRF